MRSISAFVGSTWSLAQNMRRKAAKKRENHRECKERAGGEKVERRGRYRRRIRESVRGRVRGEKGERKRREGGDIGGE